MQLENTLLKTITKKQVYKTSFAEIVKSFDQKLLDFEPVRRSFSIKKYFANGGQVSVTKQLLIDRIIEKDWLREYKTKKGNIKIDFRGLYVFVHDKTPIYVGISKVFSSCMVRIGLDAA